MTGQGPETKWTWDRWTSVGLCLLMFVCAGLVARYVFEHVSHIEDEVAYLFQAQVFATGKMYVDSPPQPNCFFAPFVLDHEGRRFGKYPPGWPALLAFGVRTGQVWWVNAACAAITVALIYRLAIDAHGRVPGVLAAGLACTSPFLLLMSGTLMAHASCLMFLTAFLWAYTRSWRRSHLSWSFGTGLLLGSAFCIRPYTAIAVALPALVDALWHTVRYGEWRRLWFIGLGGGLVGMFVPVSNAVWTGDPLLSPYVLFWPYDRIGFGPGHGVLEGGNTVWLGLSSAVASIGHLANYLHGWPALSLMFVVLLFVWKPRRRVDLFLALSALSLLLAYVAYWTNGDVLGPRYVYESAGALVVLSASGIVRTAQQVRPRWRSAYAALLCVLVLVDLVAYLPWQFRNYYGLYDITATPREVIASADLTNALVIVQDDDGWKDYAVAFSLNSPTVDGDVVYASECPRDTEQLLARYAGRNVYYFDGETLAPYEHTAGE